MIRNYFPRCFIQVNVTKLRIHCIFLYQFLLRRRNTHLLPLILSIIQNQILYLQHHASRLYLLRNFFLHHVSSILRQILRIQKIPYLHLTGKLRIWIFFRFPDLSDFPNRHIRSYLPHLLIIQGKHFLQLALAVAYVSLIQLRTVPAFRKAVVPGHITGCR